MIQIRTFVFNDFQENTYILYDGNECLIVDPGCNNEDERVELKSVLDDESLNLKQILYTHCHLDHVFGAGYIAENFPGVPFKAHKSEDMMLKQCVKLARVFGVTMDDPPPLNDFLRDNEVIKIGNSEIIALHVPGHSPGSLCYYCAAEKFLLSGDVLFAGSVGRSDLPGGDMETLLSGIKAKLLALPDDVVVYSGHGPSTTIGQERRYNSFLR